MTCLALIIMNIFGMPLWIYGHFLSSISHAAGIWTGFVKISVINFCGICLCQIMTLKCLYLTKWPTMALLNDYFLSTFFGFQNMLISILITCIRIGTGEVEMNIHFQKITGANEIAERTPLQKTVSFW